MTTDRPTIDGLVMNTNRNEPVVARFHSVDGDVCLLVSPVWKIRPGDMILVKTRNNPKGFRATVAGNHGNTGLRNNPSIDAKDIITIAK